MRGRGARAPPARAAARHREEGVGAPGCWRARGAVLGDRPAAARGRRSGSGREGEPRPVRPTGDGMRLKGDGW